MPVRLSQSVHISVSIHIALSQMELCKEIQLEEFMLKAI